ncbi:CBS domain-containing protein [Pelomonas saccharophila]|uniref:CBS domain-containing protein n=1 Tax=Roseateles saccharophilus TaxID=304 RepID=A0ABU1YIG8_ROSSA|nr:CBS domain-containing protein [Roseateles saccharophilus]MDR7268635.1 CBS domain-containing protein [Roseateles saccharophilus]
MTTIADIMSTDVRTIQPQESLRRAAQCMQELDVGALPVCDGERLLGMVTDRDITVRGIADGLHPDHACVSDIMSPQVETCTVDQDADDAKRLMGAKQLRRLPVLDRTGRLVGIVSLGDLAVRESGHIDRALREISEPAVAPAH